jgi:GNAT superfamily N-acetyltransferase
VRLTASRDMNAPRLASAATPWRIAPARASALGKINALIARSKSFWPYPAAYLALALPLLRITRDYLAQHECFEVHCDQDLAAFASLAVKRNGTLLELDHLWVEPRFIRRGAGTFTCRHLIARAHELGGSELSVLSDPPAQGFYETLAFVDTGDRVRSRVANGPDFPVLRMDLRRLR